MRVSPSASLPTAVTDPLSQVLRCAAQGVLPDESLAQRLAAIESPTDLAPAAAQLRDAWFGRRISYSRKLFLPLTRLCRDVCHYCTFATAPRSVPAPYMSLDEVLAEARRGAQAGCREALFTLGEKPELRYQVAREALADMGFSSTIDYVRHAAEAVWKETGLLPHINAGNLEAEEIAALRCVSPSMGLMLESGSERLCGKGMPHYGSPDKEPARRLATIARAGEQGVPFTSGLLIGIGESRHERLESLLALRCLHQRYGHLQELIIQNFRAKPGTLMAAAPEPPLSELLWTVSLARLLFGPDTAIQVPPNLSPGDLTPLVRAGVSDWGGVSPVTPDYVNPEAPWPHLQQLEHETALSGKLLCERLTVHPRYAMAPERWLDPQLRAAVLEQLDADGLVRDEQWRAGERLPVPQAVYGSIKLGLWPSQVEPALRATVSAAQSGHDLPEAAVCRLFAARGADFSYLCQAADALRAETCGNVVSYVVNRNINYTNICYFGCKFCAFSRGRTAQSLRGAPYDLGLEEISRRVVEAWRRGATEVCLQGGIHPDYTGDTYLDICRTVKRAAPDIHLHAFSPLEVWQGAQTLGLPLAEFLSALREAGLDTLPGTAAEILDDEVREQLCPDKLRTEQWLEVMRTAHGLGLRSTATMMFGHIERPVHWARHLLRLRRLQQHTGGFSEFVPLPFVAREAPIYRHGGARPGPTFREVLLVHAVSRLVLHPLIPNIQTSWVKLGEAGTAACLEAGANDLGGTLMNESITRAAGAEHGQEVSPLELDRWISSLGRSPRVRTTSYTDAPAERIAQARVAPSLLAVSGGSGSPVRRRA